MDIGDETKDIIDMIPEKKDNKDEENSFEPLNSILNPDFNITKISSEKLKEIIMDDIFFIKNPNWRNDIKLNTKKKVSKSSIFLF